MGKATEISWAHSTFNPMIGCTKVGPGCDHCYAERDMATRRKVVQWGPGAARKRTSEAYWREPLKWNAKAKASGQPWRVFCASLADVFDNEWPTGVREDLWALIEATPHLTWMVLTKRIGNVLKMVPQRWLVAGWWPTNVWLGITVVNQAEADRDIPKLLEVPALVRWLSCEPLIGPINLPGFNHAVSWCPLCKGIVRDTLSPNQMHEDSHGVSLGDCFDPAVHCATVYSLINWVIVGGESGPRARPLHPHWVRSLRDQCEWGGVAFHFKQWGEWHPARDHDPPENGEHLNCAVSVQGALEPRPMQALHLSIEQPNAWAGMCHLGKKAAGHLLDGREYREFPHGR